MKDGIDEGLGYPHYYEAVLIVRRAVRSSIDPIAYVHYGSSTSAQRREDMPFRKALNSMLPDECTCIPHKLGYRVQSKGGLRDRKKAARLHPATTHKSFAKGDR